MQREERRNAIATYIQQKGAAASEELAARFGVTGETIRQDLLALSEKNVVVRTLRGAVANVENDFSLEQRRVRNLKEKQSIAREALKYIRDYDQIVMDASTTLAELAKLLPEDSNVVVVTNSLEILWQLTGKSGVTAVGVGGRVRPRSKSFQGRHAEEAISTYNIQKAFISAEAVGISEGIMDTNEAEGSVKRCMIEAAKEVTLLADHTKFERMAHITVCPIGRVDRVITDPKTDEAILSGLREKGIEVIVVK